MTSIKLSAKSKIIKGKVKLTGSKSIANRVLLIRALAGEYFAIENIKIKSLKYIIIAIFNYPHKIFTKRFLAILKLNIINF